jgi:hypothetical protein
MNKSFARASLALSLLTPLVVSCGSEQGSPPWTRVFGEEGETEYVSSVLAVSDDGILVLGLACRDKDTEPHHVCRTYLLRTDARGKELWSQPWDEYPQGDRVALSVYETADKGFIVFGASRTTEKRYDVIVIKTDMKGNRLWDQTIKTDIRKALSVTRTSDGGFIIKGVNSTETGIEVIETDPEGDVLQRRTLSLALDDPFFSAFAVTGMSDGGFVVAWSESEGEFETSVYVTRTNSDGRELWSRTLGQAGRSERPGQILEAPDGGVIVIGTTGPLGPPRTDRDVYVARLEADGSRLWENVYGSRNLIESPSSAICTEGGGIVIVGESGLSDPLPGNGYLMRIDEEGNETWSRTFEGHDNWSTASYICQAPDGGFIVAGQVSRHLPDGMAARDVFLMKMDSEGNYEPLR